MNTKQHSVLTYIISTILAVIFTWLLHEFSHWLTGELLGNKMAMRMNATYPLSGKYGANWHANLISAAGPAVTILQAIIVYYLIRSNKLILIFPFLLTCLYMRAMAGLLNFINLNDEGRISHDLGIGTFTLSVLVSGLLFYLVYDTIKKHQLKTKLVLLTTLLIMTVSSVLILSDQFLKIRLL